MRIKVSSCTVAATTTALGRAARLIAIALLAVAFGANVAFAQVKAYVTNHADSTLSVIDVATKAVVGTIPVPGPPELLVINAAGSRAYVTLDSGAVAVVDLATNSVTAVVPVGVSPFPLTLSGNGAFLYVGNIVDGTVSVIDTATDMVTTTLTIGSGPHGMATTVDGASVWAADTFGVIWVIDTATNTVASSFSFGSPGRPYGIVFTPDGAFAYTTSGFAPVCTVVDTMTRTAVHFITAGGSPSQGNAITPDGAVVYQTNIGHSVSVIDTATNTVTATVAVGNFPVGVAVTPDGAFAYVANSSSNSVSVIDTATNMVVATVPVGRNPVGVALTGVAEMPPDCATAVASPGLLWPPHHQLVPIQISGIVDPAGGAVTISVSSIFQDEPVHSAGSGNTGPDATGVGTSTASVRAERDGGGDGRVYHISFTATGSSGSCTGSVTVGVPHDQSHGAPVDQGALYDSTVP